MYVLYSLVLRDTSNTLSIHTVHTVYENLIFLSLLTFYSSSTLFMFLFPIFLPPPLLENITHVDDYFFQTVIEYANS